MKHHDHVKNYKPYPLIQDLKRIINIYNNFPFKKVNDIVGINLYSVIYILICEIKYTVGVPMVFFLFFTVNFGGLKILYRSNIFYINT